LQNNNRNPNAIRIEFAGITKTELAETSQRVKLKFSIVVLVEF